MKVAFLGTPDFAVPALQKLINSKHTVVCVVTQPDIKNSPRPVKDLAVKNNIPVLQPEKISRHAEMLAQYKPDIIVTCAFGQILRQSILDLCPVINVHGSLLPKYRGAAPIQWAVINGEKETGVTIAKTELGLDCGAVIEQVKTEIKPGETAGELSARLSIMGADLLLSAIDKIENGTAVYTPQNEDEVTAAPMLTKEMAALDFINSAQTLADLIRGLNPWPAAKCVLNGDPLKIYRAAAVDSSTGSGIFISCGNNTILRIDELQPVGKRVMSAKDYLNGRRTHAIYL